MKRRGDTAMPKETNRPQEKYEFLKNAINLVFFNRIGLSINHLIKKVRYSVSRPRELRLNLGCWGVKIDGSINIDRRISKITDMVLDARRLPFPPGSVALIEAYHLVEHIPHTQVGPMLDNWSKALKEGGRLVIECPNVDETMKEYLAGNEARIYNIYGLQRHEGDFHFFGYSPKRLKELLEQHGFTRCTVEPPTDYHKDLEPCMRMTAVKKANGNRT